ncbi:hypothetical protein SAMN05216388_101249 [Halorientalis persicus]|jgi:hypothetical protein|uniref:Uncharacterized protein n=1 Tax=Halorientalis persicus TaxID=1367881 RepID=A0A1H8PHQ7_9EURY|nr:OB-fold nucleic acid binding domain-containing protein [Halorientalis persicus]SEO41247.1 hypothetical protein SAMN05216388_101249 [Halorientalis persicus]
MQRRDVLATVGAAGLTAGCFGVLEPECTPGDRELGALYESVLDMEHPDQVSIRGTVTRMSDSEMIVADGTGYAEVSTPLRKEFNTDWFGTGDCVEVSGTVSADYSRDMGYLMLEIDEGEDIDSTGQTSDPPSGPPEEPDAFFELEYQDGGFDEPTTGVTLTHDGSDAVKAKHLEVRLDPESDLEIVPWTEFADADPETEVGPGDSAVFERRGNGHLIWRPEKHWGQAVSSGWELE